MLQGQSRLDYNVYSINNFPSKHHLSEIEKEVYNDYEKNNDINSKIKNIVNNEETFFRRKRLYCNDYKKSCSVVTDDGYKIYHDVGHITEKGAEFFARIIERDKLFLKYLNFTFDTSSN